MRCMTTKTWRKCREESGTSIATGMKPMTILDPSTHLRKSTDSSIARPLNSSWSSSRTLFSSTSFRRRMRSTKERKISSCRCSLCTVAAESTRVSHQSSLTTWDTSTKVWSRSTIEPLSNCLKTRRKHSSTTVNTCKRKEDAALTCISRMLSLKRRKILQSYKDFLKFSISLRTVFW